MTTFALLAPTAFTSQQLADYQNAVSEVSAYVYAFTNATVPPLKQPPDWYATFNQQFAIAKGQAMAWTNTIVPQMIMIPNSIKDWSATVNAYFTTISICIQNNDTSDAINKLNQLLAMARSEQTTVQNLQSLLGTFGRNLISSAANLDYSEQLALAAVANDRAKIDQINQQINALKAQIQTNNQWFTYSEIGIATSVWVCMVGIALVVATGGAALPIAVVVVGVIGLGGSIVSTVVANQSIKSAQQNIQGLTQTLSALSQDVICLTQITQTLDDLITKNQAAEQALVTVNQSWQTVANNIQTLINDLQQTETDIGDTTQALTDLQNAQQDWNNLSAAATQLANVGYEYSGVTVIPQS